MKGIEQIISQLGLEDYQDQIKEAWDGALEEQKAEAVREAKEQYESKFQEEMSTVVKAAESLVHETLEKELHEFKEDKKKVYEAKKGVLSTLRKARKLKENADQKVKQRIEVFENFVMSTLGEEIKELKEDRQRLDESVQSEKLKLKKERMRAKKLSESKNKAFNNLVTKVLREEIEEFSQDRKVMTENLSKLENLAISTISEELSEFQKDRQKLQERKAELEHEYHQKLSESKKAFVKRMADSAEGLVNETLHQELGSLKEDIQQAKENSFGRKLFEAFASEFYHSHLSENTEMAKLSKKLENMEKNAEKLQKIVKEQNDKLNKNKKQLKEAVETGKREKKIDALVKSLPSLKQNIMRSLLEGVEYEKLDTSFERYLPSVLENDANEKKRKKLIRENKDSKKGALKEFTGKREKREKNPVEVFENNEDELPDDELKQMLINAGLK